MGTAVLELGTAGASGAPASKMDGAGVSGADASDPELGGGSSARALREASSPKTSNRIRAQAKREQQSLVDPVEARL
jgi:hypothetical protein